MLSQTNHTTVKTVVDETIDSMPKGSTYEPVLKSYKKNQQSRSNQPLWIFSFFIVVAKVFDVGMFDS